RCPSRRANERSRKARSRALVRSAAGTPTAASISPSASNFPIAMLLILESHPIQYRVPVYQCMERLRAGACKVIFGTDGAARGQRDPGFGREVKWDVPLLTGYVEVLRGTPLMLQLYAIFFLLPKIGLALPALAAAIIGLALNYSAYESEIYRAGLKAVPLGQFEAALSLGLTKWQALRHVLVPQAVRIVMPPVTSDFIALFKDTSVCSAITVIELTKRYSVLALSTGRIVELAVVTAVLYLCMSWPLALLSRWFESRLDQPAGGGQ
ncbi:MAG: amino acid ABC transporter permease, partial [Proteobacteria bacterium]|nr:amino acid ABC transporter permease [Pseudomonadota bacterium]